MEYQVVKKIDFNKAKAKKIGPFWYDEETDGLYHETPGFPFPVQLLISDKLRKAQVTNGMVKLPFILKGWINLDILFREIELLRMVDEGKILMHASCVNNTLIVGLPNAGKTYQTYKMRQEGGKLISEEYTILEGKTASPYKPMMRTCFSPSTVKDCGIRLSVDEQIKMFFTGLRAKLMPFMFEHAIWKEIPVSGETAKVEKIVYGSTGQEIKDWKAFAILCENEFPYMANEFLQAYALATGLDLLGIQARQRELIRRFVKGIYRDKCDSTKSKRKGCRKICGRSRKRH
jgi:hypothetical protein